MTLRQSQMQLQTESKPLNHLLININFHNPDKTLVKQSTTNIHNPDKTLVKQSTTNIHNPDKTLI